MTLSWQITRMTGKPSFAGSWRNTILISQIQHKTIYFYKSHFCTYLDAKEATLDKITSNTWLSLRTYSTRSVVTHGVWQTVVKKQTQISLDIYIWNLFVVKSSYRSSPAFKKAWDVKIIFTRRSQEGGIRWLIVGLFCGSFGLFLVLWVVLGLFLVVG